MIQELASDSSASGPELRKSFMQVTIKIGFLSDLLVQPHMQLFPSSGSLNQSDRNKPGKRIVVVEMAEQ